MAATQDVHSASKQWENGGMKLASRSPVFRLLLVVSALAQSLPAFAREVRDPCARGANLREAGWCVALTEAAYRSEACGGRAVPVTPPGGPEGT